MFSRANIPSIRSKRFPQVRDGMFVWSHYLYHVLSNISLQAHSSATYKKLPPSLKAQRAEYSHPSFFFRSGVLVHYFYTGFLCKYLERALEIQSFYLFHESKNIAASIAPKTVVRTPIRRDKERWRAFSVERASRAKVCAVPLELYVLTYHVNDGKLIFDFLDGI